MPDGAQIDDTVTLALGEDYPELRESVRKICERYPGAYWRKLENEQAYPTAPKVNPFKELYWKQYDGPGPNNVAPGTYIKPG